jgi:hypothetical protein
MGGWLADAEAATNDALLPEPAPRVSLNSRLKSNKEKKQAWEGMGRGGANQ